MKKWRFFSAGGFDQVSLESGSELASLDELDRKLWVALSCPVKGTFFDPDTLSLLDSDGDGHVRAEDVVAAVEWAASQLNDPEWLAKGVDILPLSCLSGEELTAASRHVLKALGKEEREEIGLSDCLEMKEIIADMPFNGDGVVPIDAARDEEERGLMRDIFDCTGKEGLTQEGIDSFFDEIARYGEWLGKADSSVLCLGEETGNAAKSWMALKEKAADYYRRCAMVEYDRRAETSINRSEEDLARLAALDLADADSEISAFPVAKAEAGKPLPLEEGLNPLWKDEVEAFRKAAVIPLIGDRSSLKEEEYHSISAKLEAYEKWLSEKPEVSVEKLGKERIIELACQEAKAALEELIEKDLALEPEVKGIASLEKLLRYCRDIRSFVDNFVSFRDFYTGRGKAIFQAGTLFLDGRSCELCVTVEDVAKHAQLATLSRICLAYCELRRGSERMTIAAAFTAGDSDQLIAGRNGVFYDREGRDWDATVIRIIDHPISIRQAFLSPYKTVGKLVGEQIQKIAASRTRAMQESAAKAVLESGKAEVKPPFDVGKFAGIFAAIGLAVGAIGTALASVVTGLLGLKFWQVPFALFFLVMAISGPSMVIAWLKLRQRNLGPILDANGWAVNSRARINIPFGTSLTGMAKLPEGSERALADPFAEKRLSWIWYVVLGMLFAILLRFIIHR